MQILSSYGGDGKAPVLKQAILVYESSDQTAATLNPACLDEKNRPLIGPGQPLGRADLVEVLNKLEPEKATPKTRTLLPENVIGNGEDWLLWWVPSHRRKIYFSTRDKQFNTDLNGHDVLHPTLLFMAQGNGLSAWALAEPQRPSMTTKLFRVPYMNFYSTGHMCEGTYRFPPHYRPEGIKQWERGFFDTHFSHTNMDMRMLTNHEHGHDALWREMAKTRLKYFPARYLSPAKSRDGKKQLKLSEVLDNGS
jgi:PRTRC genetic system protein B